MKTEFVVTNPDDVEIELRIRMTLRDWKTLREQLEYKWPASRLRDDVRDMIQQAEARFYPEERSEFYP